MSEHTISTKQALYVLEQWYSGPEEMRVRFRSFCFQAGLFGDDFKYVNNIKRVADCHNEPMKYIQVQLSYLAESNIIVDDTVDETVEETVEEEAQEQMQESETVEEAQEQMQVTNEVIEEQEKRLDVVIVRQGFTNMLLILLILVTSPYLAYNTMLLYYRYFDNHESIYVILDTPDVCY